MILVPTALFGGIQQEETQAEKTTTSAELEFDRRTKTSVLLI